MGDFRSNKHIPSAWGEICSWWTWDDLGPLLKQAATLSLSLACPLITIISYAGPSVADHVTLSPLFFLLGKQHKEQSDAHGVILTSKCHLLM